MPRSFSMPGGAAPAAEPAPDQVNGHDVTPEIGAVPLALFYDSETTGLPEFKSPSDDPRQPHIVQLAAALVEIGTRKTVASFDLTVRPDGWVIPDDVVKVHGITTEQALSRGVPEHLAVALLCEMWGRAQFRVAHNESFDARIVRIALKRFASIGLDPDVWKAGVYECTQLMSTPILKLPPTDKMVKAGRHHHKSANLKEAFLHFTGKELEGAHSAFIDTLACMEVYFAIKDAG